MSTLDERIAASQVQLAKNAIADPEGNDKWQRVKAARAAFDAAENELRAALEAWENLVKHAPPAWQALRPKG